MKVQGENIAADRHCTAVPGFRKYGSASSYVDVLAFNRGSILSFGRNGASRLCVFAKSLGRTQYFPQRRFGKTPNQVAPLERLLPISVEMLSDQSRLPQWIEVVIQRLGTSKFKP